MLEEVKELRVIQRTLWMIPFGLKITFIYNAILVHINHDVTVIVNEVITVQNHV